MCEQLSLLPLMHQFEKNGLVKYTTYWEIEENKNDDFYLVFHTNYYSLFLHRDKSDWIKHSLYAWVVVITKGAYNNTEDCYEIKFHHYSGKTYSIFLTNEQFNCETPLKEGWHGEFDIYVDGLYDCKQWFDYVYYRTAKTLPCNDPIEDLQEKLQKGEDEYNA